MFAHRILCLSVPRFLVLAAILLGAALAGPSARAQALALTAESTNLPIRTALHLTATAPPGATGTVTFFDGHTPVATVPLSATAVAVFASAILASGPHSFTAAYSGDPLHPASTSQAAGVFVNTILPPSFSVAPNHGVTFNSQPVTASTLGLPPDATGSVTFLDNGNPVATAPITRISGPAYVSLGDDLPAGTTLASPALAFPALLAAEHGYTLTSNAISGQAACDVLLRQIIQSATPFAKDFTQAGAPLSTLMTGTNDTANPANEPVFKLCHQAALAWLAIPREFKVLPGDAGALALSGPWHISPDLATLYNNGWSGEAQFTITSTGAPLYVWYLLDQSLPGLFTVTLDGVPDATLYNAQPATGTNTAGGLGFALLRIPVPAGPHVVRFTLQTGALGILAVGTPPAATDGSLFPTVLASDIPNENQATPRDPESIPALFSADIKANVALLAADGLDVRLVPTRSFMLGAPDAMADATHPNALGHTQLAAAFDASLPAVSPVNITMFQPNLPTASFVLPTTGARSLTAIYSGDSVYAPALSEPFVIDVQDGTTSTQLVASSPSVPYQSAATLTATVSPATATGSVSFYANGTLLIIVAVDHGVASTSQTLATGPWTLTATFNPVDGRAPSTSAPTVLTVGGRPPTFSFSAQQQGPDPAQPSALAAMLTAYLAPRSVSGSVSFTDTQTGLLATVPLVDGAAILPVANLTPGPHTYTATYSGDAVYAPLTSAPASLTPQPLATSLLASLLSDPAAVLGSATLIHVDALAPAVPRLPSPPAAFSPALNATTVFMGDSITQWWSLPLHDHGIAGQTTAQMLPRFAANVLNQGYERVIILGGTNDTVQGVDPAITLANLNAMAAQAAAAGIRPILATIPPLFITPDYSPQVFSLNASIRALAQQHGYALLDYFAAIAQHPEVLGDGVHPHRRRIRPHGDRTRPDPYRPRRQRQPARRQQRDPLPDRHRHPYDHLDRCRAPDHHPHLHRCGRPRTRLRNHHHQSEPRPFDHRAHRPAARRLLWKRCRVHRLGRRPGRPVHAGSGTQRLGHLLRQ